MNDRVVNELERAFGRECVTIARARFDSPRIPMLSPSTSEGVCEALRLAKREGWVVVPTGLGSKLGWTRPPKRADFLLSTRACTGVVAYEPGDGTLSARCGTSMAALAARVAQGGHALTPDVPRPEGSTLGGVIAAAQSGSDRLRYGPLRDHVLGLAVALSDGTQAKCGGRLVKNVTGYDLQRLFSGSHGTMCVILEASLRLFPLPEEDCLLTVDAADRDEMLCLSSAVLAADVRPIALTATRAALSQPGSEWTLYVRLGGRREVIAAERAALAQQLTGCRIAMAEEARRLADELRDRRPTELDGPMLRVEVRPSGCAEALAAIDGFLLSPEAQSSFRPRAWCEPGLAIIDVALHPTAHDAQLLSRGLSRLRAALAPIAGRARLFHARADVEIDSFAEPLAGAELMHAIRDRLDPARVFASGRFLELR